MYRTPVCCTVCVSPSNLWLQIRWDGGQELKKLMIETTMWAAQILSQRSPQIDAKTLSLNNDLVLVRPEGWNLWYRGRLLGPKASENSNDQLVQLLDFGERLTVPQQPDRLLPMPSVFNERRLASCAMPCRLARVGQRSDWSAREIKLLEGLLTMATEDLILEAEIDWEKYTPDGAGSPVPVELYQSGSGQSINDIFGQRTNSLIGRIKSSQAVRYTPVNLNQPPLIQPLLVNDEELLKPFDGRVSHVTDRGIVFVQKDEKLLAGLQNQLELFNDSCNLHGFSASNLPEKDEIFAVFMKPPSCHYRGRLLELLGGDRVRLLIIDFGFELVVDWNQCTRLPSRIRYKPQCEPFLPSGLASVNRAGSKMGSSLTSGWDDVNKKPGVVVRVTVSPIIDTYGEPTEVPNAGIEVHMPDGGRKDIVEFLLDAGVSKADNQAKDSSAGSYRSCREDLSWDVDNIVCAKCTHVMAAENETERSVFFQPSTVQAAADLLKSKLSQLSVEQLTRPCMDYLSAPAVPVLVKSDDGTNFQRGMVVKIDEATRTVCDVAFVDTGATIAGISIAQVYKLPEELLAIPTTCVKCQLSGVNDPGRQPSVGDVGIFTILGVANGAFKIEPVGK